jgi:hypothetical protein
MGNQIRKQKAPLHYLSYLDLYNQKNLSNFNLIDNIRQPPQRPPGFLEQVMLLVPNRKVALC